MSHDVVLRQLDPNSLDKYLLTFRGKVIDNVYYDDPDVISVIHIKEREEITKVIFETVELFQAAQGRDFCLPVANTNIKYPYPVASAIFNVLDDWFADYAEMCLTGVDVS